MGPEFNEKMQWARYLQRQIDEERRKERARMARIEEEERKKKEEEFKKTHYESVEELTMSKYYDYEVEEEEEEKPKESTDWSEVVLAIVYWGSLFGILIYAIIRVVNGG